MLRLNITATRVPGLTRANHARHAMDRHAALLRELELDRSFDLLAGTFRVLGEPD